MDAPLAILVVDDDPVTRRVLVRGVEDAFGGRADVESAASGEAALDRVRVRDFILVLTDYQMGFLNGIDLLELVRRELPGAIRVLVTAHAGLALAQEAIARARVHAFLVKPFSAQDLARRLSEVLRADGPAHAAQR